MTEIRVDSERAQRMLVKLAERIGDMTPVWEDFIQQWQIDIMPKTWDSKGKVMGGQWLPLTPAYAKRKQKISGKRLMEFTGDLFNAVQGGQGWYQKVSKKNLVIGVQGKEYFQHVQERATNGRYYFNTKNQDLPKRAWGWLLKRTNEYLEEVDYG